jgi:class 3 adenylate cyclase
MNMKFSLLIVLLLVSVCLPAQSNRVETLKKDLISASGKARVQKLIELAEACQEAGSYKDAETYAEEGADLADRINLPELRAIALNREGKASVALGRKGLFGKDKSAPLFRQSNDLLRDNAINNKNLAFDNFSNLRQLALKAGKEEDVAMIDAAVARLRNGGTLSPEKPISRKDLHSEISTLEQKISATQAEQMRQNKDFMVLLKTKEDAINQMTEAQVKSELMLEQQRRMVDSLSYRSRIDSMALSNRNLALKDAESSRNLTYAIIVVLVLLAGGSSYSYVKAKQNAKILEEKNKIIREEQKRSDDLLLNILPVLVADELKKQGRTHARFFEDVSVLFADFVGFSRIAEQLSPQQLVTELDTCFQEFDSIIAKFGLEKIKTIGDAYMCAGGLPDGGGSQLRDMVNAARAMQAWLEQWNHGREKLGKPRFDARIGIHNGPVVAGVVGSKKFAFDIWGDTVNIAARVEQAGAGGKINISGHAFQVVQEYFKCEYRGKIAVKNKGEIDMYYVEN